MADKKISALTAASLPLAGSEVLPIVQGGVTVKVASDNLTVKNFRSSATTGLLQVSGPAAGATRTMTVPDANFTAARTDAAQTFSGDQTFNSGFYVPGAAKKYYLYADSSDNFSFVRYSSGGAYESLPMRILPNDDISALSGNFVVGTAGKGIDFSANAHAAGMTSELLNDYEEGAWSPTVTPFSGTITSYTSSGTYTKIGNRVFFSLQVALTDNGTGAGVIDISLPYTVGAVSAGSGQNINSLWGLNGSIGAGGNIMRVARADGSYPGATGQTLRMFGSFIV